MGRRFCWGLEELGMLDCGMEPGARRIRKAQHGAGAIRWDCDHPFADPGDHTMWPVLGLRSFFQSDAAGRTRVGNARHATWDRARCGEKSGWQLCGFWSTVADWNEWFAALSKTMSFR